MQFNQSYQPYHGLAPVSLEMHQALWEDHNYRSGGMIGWTPQWCLDRPNTYFTPEPQDPHPQPPQSHLHGPIELSAVCIYDVTVSINDENVLPWRVVTYKAQHRSAICCGLRFFFVGATTPPTLSSTTCTSLPKQAFRDSTSARCDDLAIDNETREGNGSFQSCVVLVTKNDGALSFKDCLRRGMAHWAVS